MQTLLSRKFAAAALILLSAVTGFSCSHSQKKAEKAASGKEADLGRPIRVIDAHVHVHYTGKNEKDGPGFPDTPEEFARQLREVNGVGAIAHTSAKGGEDRDFKALKITPCYGLSKDPPPVAKLEAAIRKGPYRCFKIYLGYEYQWANHPKYRAVYKLAERLGVPVVFHTGDTNDIDGHLKYADPLTLDEVAVEFRKVKFVIAHIGNPWIQSAAEVAYKNPNVFIDVSALLIGNLAEYSQEDLETFVIEPIRWTWGYVENPKKLMFGTDWPLTSIPQYLDVVKKAVPKEHWDRFFYLNAAEVFGLEKTSDAK